MSFLLLVPQPLQASGQSSIKGEGIQLVHSDATEIVLELETPHYTIVEDTTYEIDCQRIEVTDYAQSGEVGAPQLPLHVALVGIPPLADFSLEVTPLESILLPSEFNACPAPDAVSEAGEGDVVRYVEQAITPSPHIYSQNQLYPLQAAKVHDLGFMRSQRMARLELFPFQVNPAAGTFLYHRRLQVRLTFTPSAAEIGAETVEASTVVEQAEFEQALSTLLVNYDTARRWRRMPLHTASNSGWQPPAGAYRIAVEEAGLYMIDYETLVAAGLAVDDLVPTHLRMLHNGQEVAIRVTGDGDGSFNPGDMILFYNPGIEERYTHTDIYWLVNDKENSFSTDSLRMSVRSSQNNTMATTISSYLATVRYEKNTNYVSSLPMLPGYDHWYGGQITASGKDIPGHRDVSLHLEGLATEPFTATLNVALAGAIKGTHHLRLYVNNHLVFDDSWQGRAYTEIDAKFPQRYLLEGDNTIRLELVNDTPNQIIDLAYLDWIELVYQRQLVTSEDRLLFASPSTGASYYHLTDFTSDKIEIYDVTTPTQVELIQGTINQNTLHFIDDQPTIRRYFAQTTNQRLQPLSMNKVTSQNLLTPAHGADYIIIAHSDFLSAIQPLANYRSWQGYRVQVIDVQTIYDQFNYGRVSPSAIQDFLAHAYHNWPAPAPAFVLLVGDGHYDPHGYLASSGTNFIPAYLAMVDPDLGETSTDNRYVAIVGEDIVPDMHIGRFPAKSAADVTAMIEKTLHYEQTTITQPWNREVLFVTDDLQGGGGAFYNFSDAVADGTTQTKNGVIPFLPDAYNKTKFYLGEQCPSGNSSQLCQQDLVQSLNQGALMVSYVGHGAKQYWAEEQLLNLSALQQLQNQDHLPIMLPMTCLEGFFHEADDKVDAFGEMIVRMPKVGAVASWSPTGFGLVSGHDYLEKGFFLAVFHNDIHAVGAAATYGKLHLVAHAPVGKYDDLLETFVLFGDPALQVRVIGSEIVENTYEEAHELFLPILYASKP